MGFKGLGKLGQGFREFWISMDLERNPTTPTLDVGSTEI